jgi:hypothetical protein
MVNIIVHVFCLVSILWSIKIKRLIAISSLLHFLCASVMSNSSTPSTTAHASWPLKHIANGVHVSGVVNPNPAIHHQHKQRLFGLWSVLATENVIAHDMLEGDNTSLDVATKEDENEPEDNDGGSWKAKLGESNKHRRVIIQNSSMLVADESISAWVLHTTKTEGLPNMFYIKKTPEPLGEFTFPLPIVVYLLHFFYIFCFIS